MESAVLEKLSRLVLKLQRFLYTGTSTDFPEDLNSTTTTADTIVFHFVRNILAIGDELKELALGENEADDNLAVPLVKEIDRARERERDLPVRTFWAVLAYFLQQKSFPKAKLEAKALAKKWLASSKRGEDILLLCSFYIQLKRQQLPKSNVGGDIGFASTMSSVASFYYSTVDPKIILTDGKRYGTTHKDILVLSRAKANTPERCALLDYLCRGLDVVETRWGSSSEPEVVQLIAFLKAFHLVKSPLADRPDAVDACAQAVVTHGLDVFDLAPHETLMKEEIIRAGITAADKRKLFQSGLFWLERHGFLSNLSGSVAAEVAKAIEDGKSYQDVLPIEAVHFICASPLMKSSKDSKTAKINTSSSFVDSVGSEIYVHAFPPPDRVPTPEFRILFTMTKNLTKCQRCWPAKHLSYYTAAAITLMTLNRIKDFHLEVGFVGDSYIALDHLDVLDGHDVNATETQLEELLKNSQQRIGVDVREASKHYDAFINFSPFPFASGFEELSKALSTYRAGTAPSAKWISCCTTNSKSTLGESHKSPSCYTLRGFELSTPTLLEAIVRGRL